MVKTFKVGDRVRLRSGGPMMTVVKVHNGEMAECVWFDDKRGTTGNWMLPFACLVEV